MLTLVSLKDRRPWVPLLLATLLLRGVTQGAAESSESLASQFPAGAAVYVEISGLGERLNELRSSEIWDSVVAAPPYQRYLESPDYKKLAAGLQIAERQLGWDAWTAATKLLGGTVGLGLYPKEGSQQPDFVVVVRTAEPAALVELRERLDPFLVLGAEQLRVSETLAGVETISLPDNAASIAWEGNWLAVSSQRELLDAAIENRSGTSGVGEKPNLAADASFQAMTKSASWNGSVHGAERHRLARVFVNTALLNQASGGKLVPEKLDHPLASLLFGDVADLLRTSPFALATLDVTPRGMSVEASLSRDAGKTSEVYRAFAPLDGPGVTAPPSIADLTGGFTLYRDFADWYSHREALLQEQVLPGFDKFESGLANLLPGRDFGEDILPLIGKRITFVAAPQDFSHLDGSPGVKLPGMAVIVELEKPEEAAALFQLFFQTLSAILNLQAGQQGRQPWVVTSESYRDVQVSYTRYLQKPSGEELGIVFNFLPASALVGNHFVLSSSLPLCKQLIDKFKDSHTPGEMPPRTALAELHFDSLTQILESDADFFVGRLTQEGRSTEAAHSEFDAMLDLLRHFDALHAETRVLPSLFQVRLEGTWK